MTQNSSAKGRGVCSFSQFIRSDVWRVPYEACSSLKYGDPIHRLKGQNEKWIPVTKLFAVNAALPNLSTMSESAGKNPEWTGECPASCRHFVPAC